MEHRLQIFLVRHGETNWNAGNTVDESEQQNLTSCAEEQIINAAAILRANAENAEAIYSSVERRAIQTAQLITENGFSELPLFQTDLINERRYGVCQSILAPVAVGGNHTPYHYSDYAELSVQEKWTWKPFPDFESDEEIRQRFLQFIEDVRMVHQRCIIAVTHGGFIRIALMHSGMINHSDWDRFKIVNGAVFKLEINRSNIQSQISVNAENK